MSRIAVMGFGNPVRSDDAVGCYVIENLKNQLPDSDSITFFDMGTSAFEVLFNLKGHDKIIIVDATTNSGEPVGTLFKLPASEVEGAIEEDPMVFLHSLKWDQALSYAKKIMSDDYPADIDVYLLAIDNTRLEVGMSPEVEKAANELIQVIKKDLELLAV